MSSISTVDLPALHNKGYLGSPNISHLVVGPGKLSFVLPFSFPLLESEFRNVCRLDVNYGDLQDMDESLLNDFAIIGESSTFKTVLPHLKHLVPRPARLTNSSTRNDFSFEVDRLGDIPSLLRYRLRAT